MIGVAQYWFDHSRERSQFHFPNRNNQTNGMNLDPTDISKQEKGKGKGKGVRRRKRRRKRKTVPCLLCDSVLLVAKTTLWCNFVGAVAALHKSQMLSRAALIYRYNVHSQCITLNHHHVVVIAIDW